MRRIRGLPRRAGVVLGLVLLAGCDAPGHAPAVARRQDNLRRTAALLDEIEAEHPARLQHTVALLEEQHARDIERTRQNADALDRAMKEEFDLWRQRQPVHRQGCRELMQGNLANLDRTLPYILY